MKRKQDQGNESVVQPETAKQAERTMDEIKRRKKRRTVTSLVVLGVCLLITFNIEFLAALLQETFNIGGVSFRTVATLNYTTSVKINEGKIVQKAGGLLIKAEGGKLQAYEGEGKLLWEKPYSGSKALVAAGGSRIFLVERGSGDFYVLDDKGEIKAKREAMGKVDRMIAKGNDFAILYKKLEKRIIVMNDKAEEVATIDLPYDEILDMDYVPSLDLIGVSVFFVEKDRFHTNVFLFGTDGRMKGARNFDSQILSRLMGYKDRFIGVTDKGFVCFDDSNADLWVQETDRVINRMAFNENGYSAYNLLIEDKALEETRDENAVAVLSPEGKWVFEAMLPVVAERLFLGQNRLAVLGDGQLLIMDFNGRVLGSRAIEGNLKEAVWMDDRQIGLEFEDRFEWYSLSY